MIASLDIPQRPMLVHRFGRFTHRQDPLLIARVVAFKQGKRIEGVS